MLLVMIIHTHRFLVAISSIIVNTEFSNLVGQKADSAVIENNESCSHFLWAQSFSILWRFDVFEKYKVNNLLYYISIDLVLDSDGIQAWNTALCPNSGKYSIVFREKAKGDVHNSSSFGQFTQVKSLNAFYKTKRDYISCLKATK